MQRHTALTYVTVLMYVCVGSTGGAHPLGAPGNGHKTTATNRGSATDADRQGNPGVFVRTELLDGLPVS